MGELTLLNLCFLIGTVMLATRIQVTLRWPIDPDIVAYLIVAATLASFWLLAFAYSLYLAVGFRFQRGASFLELEVWPKLCLLLLPPLVGFLEMRVGTESLRFFKGFGDAFNNAFSIAYRLGGAAEIASLAFLPLFGLFCWLYARRVRLGKVYFVAAVVCFALMLSDAPALLAALGVIGIPGVAAAWILYEALSGRAIPHAFGGAAPRFPIGSSKQRSEPFQQTEPDESAWGYWLSPGAFPRDPDIVMKPTPVGARAAPVHGGAWRLHYTAADEPCARKIRAILTRQPAIQEASGQAAYEIALISNRTPRRWIEQLAAAHPRLIGIFVSSIEHRALPLTLHQNQWIDYRQQKPEPILRLAKLIAGSPAATVAAIPEDFVRPVGPFPFRQTSHLLRIAGVLGLVAASSALLIQQLFHVEAAPVALVAFGAILGFWSIWAGGRILARDMTFAELCALLLLNVLVAGAWVVLGGQALLPREIQVNNGPYNSALAGGVLFIALAVAAPLVLFAFFGLVELLLHLRTLAAWLPKPSLTFGRTLGLSAWRQLDFAHAPYALALLVLVATLVANSPARFPHIQEFSVPKLGAAVEALIRGPDDDLWYVAHTFTLRAQRSGAQDSFNQHALGSTSSDGAGRADRFMLETGSSNVDTQRPLCSTATDELDCPIVFGPDGSVAYLVERPFNNIGEPTPPKRVWRSANGEIIGAVQLPAGADRHGAVFDRAGNLFYGRRSERLPVRTLGRMDADGATRDYPYTIASNIAVDPDGAVWVAEGAGDSIIRIGTDGAPTRHALPRGARVGIASLAPAPDGGVWFYAPESGEVGRLRPDGSSTLHATGFERLGARLLTGAHGSVWLFFGQPNVVVHMSSEGVVRTVLEDDALDGAKWLTVGGDGNLYYVLGREIGRITPGREHARYEIPTHGAVINQLISDPHGTVWFSEGKERPDANADWAIVGRVVP
jgi:streptogramin lyase